MKWKNFEWYSKDEKKVKENEFGSNEWNELTSYMNVKAI